ncbi:MAG TPA: IS66 family transposase [Polyangiaceae bacterium]|nr:IS66 family transposase [Polyangiaceae bacterium]
MKASTAKLIASDFVTLDLKRIRRFILEAAAEGAIAVLISTIIELLTRMRDLNQELMRQLAWKNRKRPVSETTHRLQLELPFVVLATPEPPANDTSSDSDEDDADGGKPKRKKRKKPDQANRDAHGRPKFPEHIPRVEGDVELVAGDARVCPHCRAECAHVTFKVCQKLDIEPARYVVREDKREVVACQHCHEHVATAPKRDEVFDRGVLGNELLVQSLVDYQDAVPWERMERKARQEEVPLAANTLAASCGRVIDLFDPIVRHVFKRCMGSEYVALDATSIRVLDIEHPLGIRNGALWLIQGAHCYSYFLYAKSGHADHLEAKLEGYRLVSAMCDGSATNNCVERAGANRGGCHAHARRGLVGALRGGDHRAVEGLRVYAKLFHVDAESKRAGENVEQRLARRKRDSAPLIAELQAWVETASGDAEPKSVLGKALRYIQRQWPRLTRFLDDPLMELTNNEVERDLRTWVLDRKTWLFCGHDESARRAADALTIITTCKKLGHDPRCYIRDTLKRILDGEKDLNALLPENYKPGCASGSASESVAA